MPNLLITSAGRRVSLTRFFMKELKRFYPESKVFAADQYPEFSAAAQIADSYIKLPAVQSVEYIETLIGICIENDIKLIIPTIDPELLIFSEHRGRFTKKGIIPLVSSSDFIKICNNKRKTHIFFKNHNIDVAKEYSKNDFSLPLFIKPINGSASMNTQIVKNEDEISKSQLNDESLMFLEYLDKKTHTEYTCDLYYDQNHNLTCAVPRRRIETRGGEVSKGMTEKHFLITYIKENLALIPGALGCITVQFFVNSNSNSVYGIEINPRFGGGYPLSYLAEANYPKWIIEEYFLDKKIEPFDDWKDNLLMLRYDDEIIVHKFND